MISLSHVLSSISVTHLCAPTGGGIVDALILLLRFLRFRVGAFHVFKIDANRHGFKILGFWVLRLLIWKGASSKVMNCWRVGVHCGLPWWTFARLRSSMFSIMIG